MLSVQPLYQVNYNRYRSKGDTFWVGVGIFRVLLGIHIGVNERSSSEVKHIVLQCSDMLCKSFTKFGNIHY